MAAIRHSRTRATVLLLISFLFTACSNPSTPSQPTQEASMTLTLSSPAFAAGKSIPDKYSCKGTNVSPALAWSGAPSNTASYAIIMEDPDAPSGTFVHWVIYNIPTISNGLAEAVTQTPTFDDGAAQGKNGGNRQYYEGPCPPSGTHRYFFKLYALDSRLELPPGATAAQLTKAMQGHILAQGELMGTFSK
jgi:Raf kinase inhibitor-like YbhB/YbcL family protein